MTDTRHSVESLQNDPGQVPVLGGWAGYLMRGLDGLFALLSALSLLGIVLVVVLQIVSRLMLPITLAWTEELSRYLFIWMVALSAGLILRRRRHVTLELFHHRLGRRGQALYQSLVCLLLGGILDPGAAACLEVCQHRCLPDFSNAGHPDDLDFSIDDRAAGAGAVLQRDWSA
ncbi:TRAP transporter small permease [Kushneria phosphatilytica]|uniref:TRAP transporter small permease n=1 Tax=Kushneria phosphatilytica TaxID=657387 RepID=UPI001F0B5237|nr:TRAP transporter small permease [Kushneria phosphatilytica]